MKQTINTLPTAAITVKKNRVRNFGQEVYLQDKQEFEIELFNPTQSTKAARISMNGKAISSSMIVLKPGQRVYLERFLDTTKKFLFETYSVDGNDAQVREAIAKNGEIQVDFYDEIPEPPPVVPIYRNYNYFNNSDLSRGIGGQSMDFMSGTTTTSSFSHPTSTSKGFFSGEKKAKLKSASLETGRIESGGNSNQNFSLYNGKFNSWIFCSVVIKMLPLSLKPVEVQDLATYCVNCGTKNKKGNYKFCPKCGNKF